MVYKSKMAQVRNVGDNMKIKDLLAGKNMPMDFVIGELDGFHGTFINKKSIKYYFIIEGKAIVTVDGEKTNVEQGDLVVIPTNSKHSIDGKVKFSIMCTPSFDINSEEII